MATFTYKCPGCGAELTYRPETDDFGCDYCGSHYTKAELDKLLESQKAEEAAQKPDAQTSDAAMNLYNCPNCGAQIVADATTAATFCFYCHSPVILAGKLGGAFKPDKVIPFTISKAQVKDKLLAWCRKKKFIDPAFFSDSQQEKLSGVYFPFWVVDSTVKGELKAKGTKLRVWMVGDVEYTETSVFDVTRTGELRFPDVTLKALSREDVKILDGVYPYDMGGLKPFDMAYLSGFYAEKRDVEKNAVEQQAHDTVQSSTRTLLEEQVTEYTSLTNQNCTVTPKEEKWYYALLPAWMLTYTFGGETYYFAMNAQSGKIAGRVPLSKPKLNGLFAGVAAAVVVALMLLRWLIW